MEYNNNFDFLADYICLAPHHYAAEGRLSSIGYFGGEVGITPAEDDGLYSAIIGCAAVGLSQIETTAYLQAQARYHVVPKAQFSEIYQAKGLQTADESDQVVAQAWLTGMLYPKTPISLPTEYVPDLRALSPRVKHVMHDLIAGNSLDLAAKEILDDFREVIGVESAGAVLSFVALALPRILRAPLLAPVVPTPSIAPPSSPPRPKPAAPPKPAPPARAKLPDIAIGTHPAVIPKATPPVVTAKSPPAQRRSRPPAIAKLPVAKPTPPPEIQPKSEPEPEVRPPTYVLRTPGYLNYPVPAQASVKPRQRLAKSYPDSLSRPNIQPSQQGPAYLEIGGQQISFDLNDALSCPRSTRLFLHHLLDLRFGESTTASKRRLYDERQQLEVAYDDVHGLSTTSEQVLLHLIQNGNVGFGKPPVRETPVLSPEHSKVLQLLCNGYDIRGISEHTGRKSRQVTDSLCQLRTQLGVVSNPLACLAGYAYGLVPLPETASRPTEIYTPAAERATRAVHNWPVIEDTTAHWAGGVLKLQLPPNEKISDEEQVHFLQHCCDMSAADISKALDLSEPLHRGHALRLQRIYELPTGLQATLRQLFERQWLTVKRYSPDLAETALDGKELAALQQLPSGDSYKAIAARLGMSEVGLSLNVAGCREALGAKRNHSLITLGHLARLLP